MHQLPVKLWQKYQTKGLRACYKLKSYKYSKKLLTILFFFQRTNSKLISDKKFSGYLFSLKHRRSIIKAPFLKKYYFKLLLIKQ